MKTKKAAIIQTTLYSLNDPGETHFTLFQEQILLIISNLKNACVLTFLQAIPRFSSKSPSLDIIEMPNL